MPIQCRDIIKEMERLAHPKHAEIWDKIGLQLGDPNSIVKKVMVSLDINLAVAKEAVKEKVDLIIVHHTPMFDPLEKILWNNPQGMIIKTLIQSDINLYCAHTNLDSVSGGVNDVLASMLDLQDTQILAPGWTEEYVKIVIFVPKGYEDKVRDALSSEGAGHIGNYSDCTFQLLGTGTFRPLEGTDPFIGEKGQLEKVEEYRLESIVPKGKIKQVLEAIKAVHPYEEVAYDLYPLANHGAQSGLGRIGNLPLELTLGQLIEKVQEVLNITDLRFVGSLNTNIEKVAVCGGSGASLLKKAVDLGAHAFLTGDIKYHEAQEGEALGLAIIDAGHFATEHPVVNKVANFLRQNLAGKNIEIIESKINTNPIKFFKG